MCSSNVQQRLGMPLFWNNGTDLDREAEDKLKAILGQKLTAEHAMQIALLNNRELQGVYADLGVAQADLVQAGLLKNPIFDAVVTFPVSGGRPDFELTAAMSFLDIFYIPLAKARGRRAIRRSQDARYRRCARSSPEKCARRFLNMSPTNNCSSCVSRSSRRSRHRGTSRNRLHQAGNISDLDFARERALLEGAKLRLR